MKEEVEIKLYEEVKLNSKRYLKMFQFQRNSNFAAMHLIVADIYVFI